ncbi:hypothetical protein [Chitinophaga sp. CF418]|uniref:hypothetical protein n=1 Tax=Chitinophaga sp. CF418 TaxID=1855287 RepID=UPI00091295E8|nr:hypothetical protein [Chitinophaga sp. CF418]SHN17262.1 hypothetical protein SAMN05216311_106130 [Chitinophaga sp. CF418]
MEFTIGAETVQQILTLLTNLDAKVDALAEKVDAIAVRVEALEEKVDALTVRVEALETRMTAVEEKVDVLIIRVDALEVNLYSFRKEVKEEFRVLGERVAIVEKKTSMIESRQIDIEQKFVAMEIQIESRFFSLEVLLDKNAEPASVKKNIPRHATKGRA